MASGDPELTLGAARHWDCPCHHRTVRFKTAEVVTVINNNNPCKGISPHESPGAGGAGALVPCVLGCAGAGFRQGPHEPVRRAQVQPHSETDPERALLLEGRCLTRGAQQPHLQPWIDFFKKTVWGLPWWCSG